jgi:hypothetical protein
MSLLRRVEKMLDQRLRSVFAAGRNGPGAREAIELYRDALEQIAGRATTGKRGDRVFPFNRITVELRAPNLERKAVLETLFEAGQFLEDIRAALREERLIPPPELAVWVHYSENAPVEMRVSCERLEKAVAAGAAAATSSPVAPARLVTIFGRASSPEFEMASPRVNLGREEEVVDALGRPIRRNELFFPEGEHEANASVSRSHAHIDFDPVTGDWRIFDDGSSLGTSLFREGRRIEVPAHASRGIALHPGDEIYLGQVRLRIEAFVP